MTPPGIVRTPAATIESASDARGVNEPVSPAYSGSAACFAVHSAVLSTGSPPPTSQTRSTAPPAGAAVPTALVVNVNSGPRAPRVPAAVRTFSVDAGITVGAAPPTATVPRPSTSTRKHDCVPAASSSRVRWRFADPTAVTNDWGVRRGDHTGVARVAVSLPSWASASAGARNAATMQPIAATASTPATTRRAVVP